MNATSGQGPDPYQLDQLADDLAFREATRGHQGNGSILSERHELPVLVPLSHDHPLLSSSVPFNVDAFLLSRPNTLLSDLRTELREYLANLKEELVQLINDDYAAFISLRAELRGEGPRLERLQPPLAFVKAEINKSRADLSEIQQTVQRKLNERALLREEKGLLHLLLKISDLVGRLESMLLIASPEDSITSAVNYAGMGLRDINGVVEHSIPRVNGPDEEIDEHRSPVGRAKHLARIAAEYNQLLYHTEKARKERCEFVNQLQKRMDRIESTLSRDLDLVFSAAMMSLTSSAADLSTAARSRNTVELSECLKIYDTLGKWDSAEDVIRQDLIQPFVKKTIYSGALSAPLSPILPRTPNLNFPPRQNGHFLTPTTPYTPYTVSDTYFSHSLHAPSSQNLNGRDLEDERRPMALLETNTDDPLVQLFNNILRFIQHDCQHLVDLTERVNSARSYKRYKGRIANSSSGMGGDAGEKVGNENGNEEGFDIIGRVLWAEIARAIMDELGSTIFAAGRPDEFQKNYIIVHDFLIALEHIAPTASAVASMRSHRIYKSFERRWQLPVYFQLRWKDIIGKLEDSLSHAPSDSSSEGPNGFTTSQGQTVFAAISMCWSSGVFIPELGHRFWRLTLQILSRYQTWLDASLPARKSPVQSPTAEKTASPEDTTMEDSHLRAFAHAIADIRTLESKMLYLYSNQISILLPATTRLDDEPSPENILRDTLDRFTTLVPPLCTQIIAILITRCSEPLQLVRSIPSQYRAMSSRNIDLPTEPSYFVPNILRPLREFLLDADGEGFPLKKDFGTLLAQEVFKALVLKYTSYLAGMKKTEDSIRRYKKGKRSTFMLFGSSNPSSQNDQEGRDEARIRMQMVLDVEMLGKDASAMEGLIKVQESKEFRELVTLAAQNENTAS